MDNFELEKTLLAKGFELVVGVDEAGRGPLAGPVVAAAALIKSEIRNPKFETNSNPQNSNDKNEIQNTSHNIQDTKMWDLVRDSKKLSEKQREKVFEFILENFHVGVGVCDHNTIDRINILEASFLAMKKAVQDLTRNFERVARSENSKNSRSMLHALRSVVLVDGNKKIPNFSLEQKAIVGGDALVKSIAAASIVAKVTRDRMMRGFAQEYPQYGFEKHMGYGTKQHMNALVEFGPCPIHRKSFGPVTRLLS